MRICICMDISVWFKAKEVAQILGYKNTEKAIKSHVSENHKRKILFSNQHETHGCSMTYFIDEPGFYELVFKSRLPAVKLFRKKDGYKYTFRYLD